jgi:Immunoglobulin I-set domain
MTANTKLTELGVLQFTAVTGDEQGQYICTASNAAGTETFTVELIVNGLYFDMLHLLGFG